MPEITTLQELYVDELKDLWSPNDQMANRVPDTLLGPTSEPHIDRVPLAVALVHVAPRQGQPTLSKYNIPFRNNLLSYAGRALRPRSGGGNAPMIAHSPSARSSRA